MTTISCIIFIEEHASNGNAGTVVESLFTQVSSKKVSVAVTYRKLVSSIVIRPKTKPIRYRNPNRQTNLRNKPIVFAKLSNLPPYVLDLFCR